MKKVRSTEWIRSEDGSDIGPPPALGPQGSPSPGGPDSGPRTPRADKAEMTKPSDRHNGGRWLVNAAKQTQYSHHSDDVTCRGAPMKFIPGRFRAGAWLCACVASAALVGAALAQPPKPGGAGGGGGPGARRSGPGGGGPVAAPAVRAPVAAVPARQRRRRSRCAFATRQTTSRSYLSRRCPSQDNNSAPRAGRKCRLASVCRSVSSSVPPCSGMGGPGGNGLGRPQSKPGSVRQPGSGFDFTWDGSARSCQQGETAVPFMKIEVQPNVGTFDMTLN